MLTHVLQMLESALIVFEIDRKHCRAQKVQQIARVTIRATGSRLLYRTHISKKLVLHRYSFEFENAAVRVFMF